MSGAIPLVAGALLAAAEFVFATLTTGEGSQPPLGRRVLWSGATGMAGVLVSAAVLLVATVPVARSLGLTVAATAAAVAVVGVLGRRWKR